MPRLSLLDCIGWHDPGKRSDRTSNRVIAECKNGAPGRGLLKSWSHYEPDILASAYSYGQASAISVVTSPLFGGSIRDLSAVRLASSNPILCKDFIYDKYQIHEARAAGAHAVLLIAGGLTLATLTILRNEARAARVEAVVEVHTKDDVYKAMDADAHCVLINNRDLNTLEVDMRTVETLIDVVDRFAWSIIAASGYSKPEQLGTDNRIQAYLVGRHLLESQDPEQALRDLRKSI